MTYILAIDQGTTSTRSIIFDDKMQKLHQSQMEFEQHFPNSGWVEHNPEDILSTTLQTLKNVVSDHQIDASKIAAVGITNQRETTIVWDKNTGKAIYNAIVWQDRRTADYCSKMKELGHEAMVSEKTGLLLDPYFSATKIAWILDHVEGARAKAEAGDLLFGTVDCFLIWHLTGGKSHKTDATNASRTMLYNISEGAWDEALCELFDIPMNMLPEVLDNAADYGQLAANIIGAETKILGVAGDQQAAAIGQACFEKGMMKSTYGTGCFMILNSGDQIIRSKNKLLSTICYQLNGQTTYALEGSIFNAGTVVQWLRDGIQIIDDASQTGAMAEIADPNENVYLVPAFTGLGAPYWDAECRGAIYGLTRNTGRNEFAKAALEAVCFQTKDLLNAMLKDWADAPSDLKIRVDGGMVKSNWTMQFLADMLCVEVDRPKVIESTAMGAAWLAGMHAGIYPDMQAYADAYALEQQFSPDMNEELRQKRYAEWQDAVKRTLS